jgi:hypothetical protein
MDNLLFDTSKVISPALSRILDRVHQLEKGKTRLNYIIHSNVVYSVDKQVHYIAFGNIAMGDADWDEAAHKTQKCVTISKISDLTKVLKPWLIDKGMTARLYLTAGGLRWFITSKRLIPTVAKEIGFFEDLPVDPLYADLSLGWNPWKKQKLGYQDRFGLGLVESEQLKCFEKSWSVRISPKLTREDDFIAIPIGKLGNVDEDQSIVRELQEFHDVPIRKSWTEKSLNNAKEVFKSKCK